MVKLVLENQYKGTTVLFCFRSLSTVLTPIEIEEFKDFSRPLSDFSVLFKSELIFMDFSSKSPKFKFFSSLCEPWASHSTSSIGFCPAIVMDKRMEGQIEELIILLKRMKIFLKCILLFGNQINETGNTIANYKFVGCWFCCFTSQVNSYGHCGTVSSPNHTFSWAGLNKRLTSNCAHTFACNWQQPFLNEWAEGRKMTVEIISWSISTKVWDRAGI